MARTFISYHTVDRPIALALKEGIERDSPGADVFVDSVKLRYGQFWQPALFEAIEKSDSFLIVVGNRLGEWQKVEYYAAFDRRVKEQQFVLLPIITADRLNGSVPNLPGLTQLQWIEASEPTAPAPLAKIVAALAGHEVQKPSEPWRTINPYRGLLALEEQDADFFFGREQETNEIIDLVGRRTNIAIALIGNSGVGKSSLVQAGVIGSLKRRRLLGTGKPWPNSIGESREWVYLTMKPGENPIETLAAAFTSLWFDQATDPDRVSARNKWAEMLLSERAKLTDLIDATECRFRDELNLAPPHAFFLYIDQGEELFSRATKPISECFSRLVANGLDDEGLIVMTSLRSDYYGNFQSNGALFPRSVRVDIAPLGIDALGSVLREPAKVLNASFDSDQMIDLIVRSSEGRPGSLPLLADLMTDLWDRMQTRGDGKLSILDRKEIVQIGASLIARAEAYLRDNPGQIDLIRSLFTLKLARLHQIGAPVRIRVPRTDCTDEEWRVLESLAGPKWRLITTSQADGLAHAEVAHEVLLTEWPRLKSWLMEQGEFLVWMSNVESAYDQWKKTPFHLKSRALLGGYVLLQARTWRKTKNFGQLSKPVTRYVRRSMRRGFLYPLMAITAVVLIACFGLASYRMIVHHPEWTEIYATDPKKANELLKSPDYRDVNLLNEVGGLAGILLLVLFLLRVTTAAFSFFALRIASVATRFRRPVQLSEKVSSSVATKSGQ